MPEIRTTLEEQKSQALPAHSLFIPRLSRSLFSKLSATSPYLEPNQCGISVLPFLLLYSHAWLNIPISLFYSGFLINILYFHLSKDLYTYIPANPTLLENSTY